MLRLERVFLYQRDPPVVELNFRHVYTVVLLVLVVLVVLGVLVVLSVLLAKSCVFVVFCSAMFCVSSSFAVKWAETNETSTGRVGRKTLRLRITCFFS